MTSKEIKSSLCIGGDLKRGKTAGRKKAVNRKHGKYRKNSVEMKGKERARYEARENKLSISSARKESL